MVSLFSLIIQLFMQKVKFGNGKYSERERKTDAMASLKEKSNQHLSQNGQGLDGIFRGVIRKQMADGRVKVFIPGVNDP